LFRILLNMCLFCFLQYTALPPICNCPLFCMRSGPPPVSGGAFYTTVAVTSFPLSKVAGRVLLLLASLAGLFIYNLPEGVPLPHSLGLGAPSSIIFFQNDKLFLIQFFRLTVLIFL
jgi:hypothetical protein